VSTPTAPVPFFTDERTLAEKLECDRREWRPHQPEHDCPNTIFGLVLERGTYTSSYGEREPRETARILTADNIEWSVIAFHGYLQSEFRRKQPRDGDFIALAFQGTKPAKRSGENDAYAYTIEVERNPTQPLPLAEPVATEPEPAKTAVRDPEAGTQEMAFAAAGTAADDDIPF
jgi:hypothetical protein